jgi:NADH:ubiquinone oxidoreductase subunit F (NADH-binding)
MTGPYTQTQPVRAGQAGEPPRLLPPVAGRTENLRSHLARTGRPRYRGQALLQAVVAAGLTGRGGAAFPTHIKLAAVARARGRTVVVANGAEGEPASGKDAALLYHAPHLVLDGLQLAAEATGAAEAYVYAHAWHVGWIQQALAERADDIPVTITEAPARFLAGQETALVSRVSGGPALPTFAVRRVTERGVHGAPTLVQNVETLAHLALIARHGPDWFRQKGTPAEPGTMLATVHGKGRPVIAELELGTPLADLITDGAAVLIGGYHGTWLPMATALTVTLDNLALRQHHAALGAGVIAVLPHQACGLIETARVTHYLAAESAGQCGPCLNGLPRIAAAMAELARPRPRASTVRDVERWTGLVTGRGACHHPDGTARLVRSALTAFAGELRRHTAGQCSATAHDPVLPIPPAHALPSTDGDWL